MNKKRKKSLVGVINTDKEIWRKEKDNYYAPSIHVTQQGRIGINVGGEVIVLPVEIWHKLRWNMPMLKNDYKSIQFNFTDQLRKFIINKKLKMTNYSEEFASRFFRITIEEI